MPRWRDWSRAQWNSLGGGNVDWGTIGPMKWSSSGSGGIDRGTIGPQRRGLRREKTIKNLRTKIGVDYSNNTRRGI